MRIPVHLEVSGRKRNMYRQAEKQPQESPQVKEWVGAGFDVAFCVPLEKEAVGPPDEFKAESSEEKREGNSAFQVF